LLQNDSEHARDFPENIQRYNAAFSFTFIDVSRINTHIEGHGPYVFQISRRNETFMWIDVAKS
jgi:hypothetical protein